MDIPTHMQPFVVALETATPERKEAIDLYPPPVEGARPAIVFVHGGPIPADLRPTPRDWPVFHGYGALAAANGVVGVTLDHGLHAVTDFPQAASNVAAAVEAARSDARVDADRVAIWFFSGGGLLMADWLRTPPSWLRCVAASYPVLAAPPGMGLDRFQPAQAVTEGGTPPIVLTRVGRERPEIAATVETFVTSAHACGARLEIVDVPDGQHGFDVLDHNDRSRKAIERAMESVLAALV